MMEEIRNRWKKIIDNYYDYRIENSYVVLRDAEGNVLEQIHINGLINGFLENVANQIGLKSKEKKNEVV